MRNVFLFIRRYFNLVFFLALQVAALMILFRYNKFHESIFSVFSNEFAGRVNTRFNSVETYFTLKKENELLREQNAVLLNRLKENFIVPDTSVFLNSDTVRIDTTEQYRRFYYMPAKVISNSVNAQQNFIMLHRGYAQGVSKNMAVVGTEGVIGTVVSVSKNMCMVMSVLHRQSRIVAVLKKGSGFGEVTWDGMDPRYVTLTKVPKTVPVSKGDTVVTSQYSDKYPPGYNIGFIESVEDDPGSNAYKLKVKTATDFYTVQHGYIVRNLLKEEMDELEKTIKRN